jgi:hypothetical protein
LDEMAGDAAAQGAATAQGVAVADFPPAAGGAVPAGAGEAAAKEAPKCASPQMARFDRSWRR